MFEFVCLPPAHEHRRIDAAWVKVYVHAYARIHAYKHTCVTAANPESTGRCMNLMPIANTIACYSAADGPLVRKNNCSMMTYVDIHA